MGSRLTGTQALKYAKEMSFEGLREAAAWRMAPTKLPGHKLKRGPPPKAFFRRGDLVEVISGPEMGKRGNVYKVYRYDKSLLVKNVNLETTVEEFRNANNELQTRKTDKMKPVPFGSVRLIDPIALQPTEITHNEDGQRISVLTGNPLPITKKMREIVGPGPRDTPTEKYTEETFSLKDPWQPPFPVELTR